MLVAPKYTKSIEFALPQTDLSALITLLGLFTKQECELIINEASALTDADAPGATGGVKHNGTVDDYRRTKTCWLKEAKKWQWVYDRIHSQIRIHNDQAWRFHLDGAEVIQFSQYPHTNAGHYDWHDDAIGTPVMQRRKLSCSVQLSDPRDYDGGELELWPDKSVTRAQGSAFIFPSFLLHRVTPVERGTRCSLVAWATGNPFK